MFNSPPQAKPTIRPLGAHAPTQGHHAPQHHTTLSEVGKKHDDIIDPCVDNASKYGPTAGDGPLTLIEEKSEGPKRIQAIDHENVHRDENFKRPLLAGQAATRVRSFHAKYSDEGLKFMDNQINHWLDDHPEIAVKFVTSTVMQFVGKTAEPQLVLNVWY